MKAFLQHTGLKIIASIRNPGGGDTEELVTLVDYVPVRQYFKVVLNSDGDANPWEHCQPVSVPVIGIPTLDTYLDEGVLDWKISAAPFRVPGVLELAWYLDPASGIGGGYVIPDLVQTFTLDNGTDLVTPSLDVYPYDSDPTGANEAAPYIEIRFRWYPSKLAELL